MQTTTLQSEWRGEDYTINGMTLGKVIKSRNKLNPGTTWWTAIDTSKGFDSVISAGHEYRCEAERAVMDWFRGTPTREPDATYPELVEALIAGVMDRVEREVRASMRKHRPMYSPHEGHSVIREELDELWDHVKADTGTSYEGGKEAVQVAAMGIRYLIDVYYGANAGYKFDTRD